MTGTPGTRGESGRASRRSAFRTFVAERTAPAADGGTPTYAQVVGAINRLAGGSDLALTSAGGLPGEMNVNWLPKGVGTFDCEYGYSTMGYEIAGAWGARMGRAEGEVIAFVGDGSYLMLNSELYSATLAGHKLIVVLCDNGGYAVIHRLQVGQGGAPYGNMLEDVRPDYTPVDWVSHARSLGCLAEEAADIAGLEAAFERARAAERTTVILDSDGTSRLDAGWRLLGGGRPRGDSPRRRLRGARATARREAAPTDQPVSAPIRIGILGVGRIGRMHARLIAGGEVPGLELSVVYDIDAEAAQAVGPCARRRDRVFSRGVDVERR